MTEAGWNHNTHYHERLLQALPPRCGRALDVGCGRGVFARRLAGVAGHVDALDRDRQALDHARANSANYPNVTFIEAEFTAWDALARYDVISMVATLHHLPFAATLEKAAKLLQPDGTLIVLGLHRARSPIHLLGQALVAVPVSRFYRLTRNFCDVGAPIAEPEMTFAEIADQAQRHVPGAVLRRHLLWRYSMVWTKAAGARTETVTAQTAS